MEPNLTLKVAHTQKVNDIGDDVVKSEIKNFRFDGIRKRLIHDQRCKLWVSNDSYQTDSNGRKRGPGDDRKDHKRKRNNSDDAQSGQSGPCHASSRKTNPTHVPLRRTGPQGQRNDDAVLFRHFRYYDEVELDELTRKQTYFYDRLMDILQAIYRLFVGAIAPRFYYRTCVEVILNALEKKARAVGITTDQKLPQIKIQCFELFEHAKETQPTYIIAIDTTMPHYKGVRFYKQKLDHRNRVFYPIDDEFINDLIRNPRQSDGSKGRDLIYQKILL